MNLLTGASLLALAKSIYYTTGRGTSCFFGRLNFLKGKRGDGGNFEDRKRPHAILLDAIERLCICNIIDKTLLVQWRIIICPWLCPTLSTLSYYHFYFILFLLISSLIVSILIIIVIMIIFIIIITIIVVKIEQLSLLSKLLKLWLSPQHLCLQDSNQLSQLKTCENDQ